MERKMSESFQSEAVGVSTKIMTWYPSDEVRKLFGTIEKEKADLEILESVKNGFRYVMEKYKVPAKWHTENTGWGYSDTLWLMDIYLEPNTGKEKWYFHLGRINPNFALSGTRDLVTEAKRVWKLNSDAGEETRAFALALNRAMQELFAIAYESAKEYGNDWDVREAENLSFWYQNYWELQDVELFDQHPFKELHFPQNPNEQY